MMYQSLINLARGTSILLKLPMRVVLPSRRKQQEVFVEKREEGKPLTLVIANEKRKEFI